MIKKIEKFGATWCGPCKALDETLKQLKNIEIIKHDADVDFDMFGEKQIRTVPTLLFIDENDQEKARITGAVSLDKIKEILSNLS